MELYNKVKAAGCATVTKAERKEKTVPEFDLRVFQSPSGADVQRMAWQEKN